MFTITKKAVVYARVSTDKEEQQSSLELQKEYYTQYAKQNDYEFVKLYYDEGLSATSSNREDFLKMLYDAGLDYEADGNQVYFKASDDREPLFDWIIIKDVDRFARNTDSISIVRELRDKSVYIEFESLTFTTKDDDWEFRLNLLLTFAQQESLDKSRKLKDSYLKRAKKGDFYMSVNLLGYGKIEGKKEHYVKEDEAIIVRKIFDYYTEDKVGSYEIADRLNERGYTTKQKRRWTGSSVNRILNNEKYKGQVILNRYNKTDITGSNKRVINPKSEWVIHDNAIPKIVTVEQFNKAQEIMTSRSGITRQTRGSDKRQVRGRRRIENIFYKKIYCGKCGSDYIRETTTKTIAGEKVRKHYYGCRARRNYQRNKKKCMNRGISHDVLVRELTRIGKNLSLIDLDDESLVREEIALEDKINNVNQIISNSEQHKAEIDNKIADIDKKISNLFSTLAEGVSDTIRKLTQEQIEDLEQKKVELEASKTNFDVIQLENKKRRYEEKFNEILEMSKKESYTFEEMLGIVHYIEIMNNGKVIVKFKVPTLRVDDDMERLVHYMIVR